MKDRTGEIKPIADVTILAAGRVLLVRYADVNSYDHQRGWFLPDDAVRHLEHPDRAAARILNDQLGLAESTPTLNHIESFAGRDRSWHLVFHYRLDLPAEPMLRLSPDLAESAWFGVDSMPARDDVAHGGWALSILDRILGEAVPV